MKTMLACAIAALCTASAASASTEWETTPVMSDLTPGKVLYVTWGPVDGDDDAEQPEPVAFGGWHNPGTDVDNGGSDDSDDFGGWSK